MSGTAHFCQRDRRHRLRRAAIEQLEPRQMLIAGPIITEFMADNDGTLLDGDGNSSDWIEIYNPETEAVDLAGWYLTDKADNLTKWTFPSVALAADSFLVVFASASASDNYVDAGGNLHTNFSLERNGETLALVHPDAATIASQFGSATNNFPQQFEDVSYGIGVSQTTTTFVAAGAEVDVFVPTDGSLANTWTQNTFTPGPAWTTGGATGVGFSPQAVLGSQPPLAYWPLDEGSGSSAAEVISGYDGMLTNMDAASDWIAGPSGGGAALDLDGQNDYLSAGTVPAELVFSKSAPMTVSAWIFDRGDAVNTASIVGTLNEGPFDGWALARTFAGSEVLRFEMKATDGRQFKVDAAVGHPLNQWIHVAVTYDGSNSAEGVTLYVNGSAVAAIVRTNQPGGILPSNKQLTIGSYGGTSRWLNGSIDDVALWDVELTGPQIAALADGSQSPLSLSGIEAAGPGSYDGLIGTDTGELMLGPDGLGINATAYIRVPFDIAQLSEPGGSLRLGMRYDDGFVAYLNGVEVARRNAPGAAGTPPESDAVATNSRTTGEAVVSEEIDISQFFGLLSEGDNVLAIHGLNIAADDPTFLILPELSYVQSQDQSVVYLTSPTPGAANGEGINNSGPAITSVTHSPARPTANEDLIVTAQITELENPLSTAMMTYRVMFGAEVSRPMADDGSGNDALAGDGIFTATIPAAAFSDGQMVRFFITTADTAGNPARKPEFLLPERSAEYFGTVVLDPSIPATQLPVLEWFVEDSTWFQQPGGGNNRDITFASAFYDGNFYDNFRVRTRGAVSSNAAKANFKFDFFSGGRFRYDPAESKVEEFNLQSFAGEGDTRTFMRNPLAYQLFRDSGQAAPLSFYVHVRQNGQFYSLSAIEEQIDDTFLKRNGLDSDGALYKAQNRPNATLEPNPTPTSYRKANREDEDFSDLTELTIGLNLTDPQEREAFVFDNLNVPQVINYLAISVLGPNHDRIGHNYYVHRDTTDTGEWSVIPFDLDRWFPVIDLAVDNLNDVFYGDSDHPRSGNPGDDEFNRLNDAIFDIPATREMYLTRLRSVIDEWMGSEPSYLENAIDTFVSRISLDAALDNAKWGLGSLSAGVAALKNTIGIRRSMLQNDPNLDILVPGTPQIGFGTIVFNPISGNQDEEYIELVNSGTVAADVSGWQLTGGISYTFGPGTVILPGGSLYVSPDVRAFRSRATGPSGGQSLLVQGNYSGNISNIGETIELVASDQTVVATVMTPEEPSPAQQFLRVTEINYNPPGPGDPTEFIELQNISSGDEAVSIDLEGVTITHGPSEPFVFAAGTLLAAGEYVLVVKDQVAFTDAYPNVDVSIIAGQFVGSLSNGGEKIHIDDAEGGSVLDFRYEDGNDPLGETDWHPATDGEGRSLVIIDPLGETDRWDTGVAWRASHELGGSPGMKDVMLGDLNGDDRVSLIDLALLQSNLGTTLGVAHADGDLSGDGAVDRRDVALFVRGLGRRYDRPTIAPAPAAVIVAAIDRVYSEGDVISQRQSRPMPSGRRRITRRTDLRAPQIVTDPTDITPRIMLRAHRQLRNLSTFRDAIESTDE